FHGATEGLWPDLLLSGIPFRDAEWYQGWMDRTAGWAGVLHLRYPWLAAACRREELYEPLLTAPHSVVHGEFTPANVLLRDGEVYPVDWESAALAPGELDLAFFTLGWPGRLRRRIEAAYARRRWPGGPPPTFEATLRAARIHACFRVLGDSPTGPSAGDARTIFRILHSLV
ncbi:MAG TPA: phosphotransferase, partial [Acidimicrobiia bacterium]|nr:phosphotransferase [Acidimicrobiia bacterium]